MARTIVGAWLTATLATIAGVLLGFHPVAIRDATTLVVCGFILTQKR